MWSHELVFGPVFCAPFLLKTSSGSLLLQTELTDLFITEWVLLKRWMMTKIRQYIIICGILRRLLLCPFTLNKNIITLHSTMENNIRGADFTKISLSNLWGRKKSDSMVEWYFNKAIKYFCNCPQNFKWLGTGFAASQSPHFERRHVKKNYFVFPDHSTCTIIFAKCKKCHSQGWRFISLALLLPFLLLLACAHNTCQRVISYQITLQVWISFPFLSLKNIYLPQFIMRLVFKSCRRGFYSAWMFCGCKGFTIQNPLLACLLKNMKCWILLSLSESFFSFIKMQNGNTYNPTNNLQLKKSRKSKFELQIFLSGQYY